MRPNRTVFVLVVWALSVTAAPLARADSTAACMASSLANYIGLGNGGCNAGSFVISGFTYSAGPNAPLASQIEVVPIVQANGIIDIFLDSINNVNTQGPPTSALWNVGANSNLQFDLSFSIASTNASSIQQIIPDWFGSFLNANLQLQQVGCIGGVFSPNCSGIGSPFSGSWAISSTGMGTDNNGNPFGPCDAAFGTCSFGQGFGGNQPFAVGSVDTQYSLSTGGNGYGQFNTSFIIITNAVQTVAEPGTLPLFAVGLLGLVGAMLLRMCPRLNN